jgi:hypothetical protein
VREQEYGKERLLVHGRPPFLFCFCGQSPFCLQTRMPEQIIPFSDASNNVPARVLCEKIKVVVNKKIEPSGWVVGSGCL